MENIIDRGAKKHKTMEKIFHKKYCYQANLTGETDVETSK